MLRIGSPNNFVPPVPRTHKYWEGHCPPPQLLWWRRPCL